MAVTPGFHKTQIIKRIFQMCFANSVTGAFFQLTFLFYFRKERNIPL